MAANALKKINARVKVLAKKHPKKARKTLQKQAGAEYRAGKLSAVKKRVHKTVRKKVAKKKPVTHKRKPVKKGTRVRVVHVVAAHKVKKRRKAVKHRAHPRRVSGAGKKSSVMPFVVLGGLALAAYFLLRPSTAATLPAIAPRPTPTGAASANNLLQWAAAANLGVTAISKLIDAINNSSDSSLSDANSTLQATGQPPANFLTGD